MLSEVPSELTYKIGAGALEEYPFKVKWKDPSIPIETLLRFLRALPKSDQIRIRINKMQIKSEQSREQKKSRGFKREFNKSERI